MRRNEWPAAGLTRKDLRSEAVTPVTRGVFVVGACEIDHATRCAALLKRLPAGSRIAGLDAARLWGLPAPARPDLQAVLPAGADRRIAGVELVRGSGVGTACAWLPRAGTRIALTPPDAVLPECLPHVAFVEAVALADAVLRRSGSRHEALRQVWADAGVKGLARIAEAADALSESPPESRLRCLVALAGLPPLEPQHVVAVAGQTRRLDLSYPDLRIAVEYDGEHHFASERQKQADIGRDEQLRAAGWICIHVVARDLYRDPAGILRRLAAAMAERGEKATPGQGWRQHFPQLD